jgi:hypothetical protein
MKKLTAILLLAALFSAPVFAQIRKVPAAVTEALKTKFPQATNVSWKDKLSSWEADFTNNGTETAAWFTNKGEWKETDRKLSFNDLPADVKDGLKKSKYSDWTPGSVVEIKKKDKDLQYRIYVEKSSLVQKKYLYFNEKGVLQREAQTL